MITALSRPEAVDRVALSLALSDWSSASGSFEAFLSQTARRAITIMAPCRTHELVHAIVKALPGIGQEAEAFTERVEGIVEDLIVYGDILEMRQANDDLLDSANDFLLRPGPPSFVVRADGSIAILGIAGEELTPLTAELNSQVIHQGVLRILPMIKGAPSVEATLLELGLFRLPEKTWLRIPAIEAPQVHIAHWTEQLMTETESGAIEGLSILDTQAAQRFYRDRWTPLKKHHDGVYVARRPQRYGAALWCCAEIRNGILKRFKDLIATGDRIRPFDLAWRLQAAMDAAAGKAQAVNIGRGDGANALVRFFSPIPSWSERYLAVSGRKIKAGGCLFAFEAPAAQATHYAAFLKQTLWMQVDERTAVEVKR